MCENVVSALRTCVDKEKGCADCLYYHKCMNTSGKHAAMVDAADAIEELSKPRWIPVTERLPEQKINQNTLDFEYVLCATTFGDVRPYKFGRRIGQGEPHFWNGAGYVDAYVTHWMPLPEPPKEEA